MTPTHSPARTAPSWTQIIRSRAERAKAATLPPAHHDDLLLFAEEALGLTPWPGMRAILEGIRDHDRVAVRAGRKVSKTASGAAAAIWWAMRGGKVMVTAPTGATLSDPFWIELGDLLAKLPTPPHLPKQPSTPIETPAGGRIVGRQAARRENLQGPSGADSLYIIEESSGVRREIVEAIEGNVAGGGKILMLGNPTMLAGSFYDAFHKRGWHTIHISSRDSPNVTGDGPKIPGLAIPAWIEEMEEKHGENSPFIAIHVDGEFPTTGANSVVPQTLVLKAEERWTPTPPETENGALTIGIDVARSGDDASVIQPVRGAYAYQPTNLRNQTGPTLGAAAIERATNLRRGTEPVTLHVDVIGVGAAVFDYLTENAPDWITTRGINVAEVATSTLYHRLRDQLAFSVRTWLEEQPAAIPTLDELRTDLIATTYRFDPRGRYVVASKDELKETLGRSPDNGDALALAVYTPPPPFEPAPPIGWE